MICAVILFFLEVSRCASCTVEPVIPRINCSLMECCDSVTISSLTAKSATFKSGIEKMRQRVAPISRLIEMLSQLQPAQQHFANMSDVSSKPLSVEVIQTGKLKLYMHLQVFRIFQIDQKTQTFKMHYSIRWTWRNCQLIFQSTQSCMGMVDFDSGHVHYRYFWRPLSSIAEREDDIDTMRSFRHMIFNTGEDFFSEDRVSTFRCTFNFQDMPYDEQHCLLRFSLPDQPAIFYDLNWDEAFQPIEAAELTNSEWLITPGVSWKTIKGSYFNGMYAVSMLEAHFTFKRRSRYLSVTYVMSGCLFYLLSWIGLWIDPSAVPARAAVGIIPVLIIVSNLNALLSSIPPVSYSTRLGDFMTLTLVMSVAHMLQFGAVHFTIRRAHRLTACKAKVESYDAGQPNDEGAPLSTRQPRFVEKFDRRLSFFLRDWADPCARALSLLIYTVFSIFILVGFV